MLTVTDLLEAGHPGHPGGERALRVLIACEYSGIERDAFRALGHDATSCDLLPTERPGPHHRGDVRDLMGEPWDLVIAHPPCTYLSNSGVRWLYSDPTRWQDMLEGAVFFRQMFAFNAPRIAVENPVQHKWAKLAHGMGDPDQTVQPWQFGHPETKRTCYWLRGLPQLTATHDVRAENGRAPQEPDTPHPLRQPRPRPMEGPLDLLSRDRCRHGRAVVAHNPGASSMTQETTA